MNPSSPRRAPLMLLALYLGLSLVCGLLLTGLFQTAVFGQGFQVVFGILLLGLLRFWTGAWMFLVLQLFLLLNEPRGQGTQLDMTAYFAAALSVLLLGFAARYQAIKEGSRWGGFRELIDRWKSRRSPTEVETQAHADDSPPLPAAGVRQVLGLVASVVIALALAATILSNVELESRAARAVRLTPTALRLIELGFGLIAVYVFAWMVIDEYTWRRLKTDQARLYLRSSLMAWLSSDFSLIERRKVRLARMLARRKRKPRRSKDSG